MNYLYTERFTSLIIKTRCMITELAHISYSESQLRSHHLIIYQF